MYVAAIDQGTTSSRCMIFDHDGLVVASAQKEHEQIFPRAGWVEHDPEEIWRATREVVAAALAKKDLTRHDIAAVGITNQRETTVVWDRRTGKPVYNAIVWQDTRTDELCTELAGDEGPGRYRERTGLPLSTYFSGPKIRWILDNVEGPASEPRLVTSASARWTPGSCGTSPAARTVDCTSRIRPTLPGPC
ncbi:FGGY family of carbohydrate kinase, N-terminal domain protein [Rhodococcus sp. MTM3W5.2]|nr:FGGY family of carbohydrate kinase, N-terminal domain protein [Rhodococcus sp. MTM3W5.2]